ncbi:MAG: hypothetical protein H9777_08980 [Candidatus Phocaeicola faecigallinarum]|uniref:DUF3244 domain-containing protein n=1 Tax=Candidatus Phocaeicola faecigallinarum TaxID=2838732 RepID=A0A948WX60_9BACT|nr:hypothetical protein [Candidatus Phocaeicola faecigallinarum]
MRTTLTVIMIVLGFGNTFAYTPSNTNEKSTTEKTYKSFTNIDINELPSEVQEVLFFDFKDYIVKTADVKKYNGTKIYKITLLDIENYEYTIYINEKGIILE